MRVAQVGIGVSKACLSSKYSTLSGTDSFQIISYYVPYVELGAMDMMTNKTIYDSCLNKSYSQITE